jgi:hypothetical protein
MGVVWVGFVWFVGLVVFWDWVVFGLDGLCVDWGWLVD